ncbi:hypothetical protein [Actinoplanes xinjiangensis]|nr:hypothetical protein [Actinoplanes xinjiangensis]
MKAFKGGEGLSSAIKASLSVVFTLSLLGGMASPAAAVGAGDEAVAEKTMTIAGFDVEVARAHGYEVVTLPGGAMASVPADKADAARAGDYVPAAGVLLPAGSDGSLAGNGYGESAGDCGYSVESLIVV